jgi:hypothetical protein
MKELFFFSWMEIYIENDVIMLSCSSTVLDVSEDFHGPCIISLIANFYDGFLKTFFL